MLRAQPIEKIRLIVISRQLILGVTQLRKGNYDNTRKIFDLLRVASRFISYSISLEIRGK